MPLPQTAAHPLYQLIDFRFLQAKVTYLLGDVHDALSNV